MEWILGSIPDSKRNRKKANHPEWHGRPKTETKFAKKRWRARFRGDRMTNFMAEKIGSSARGPFNEDACHRDNPRGHLKASTDH
jgi:hypothetical protein